MSRMIERTVHAAERLCWSLAVNISSSPHHLDCSSLTAVAGDVMPRGVVG